MSFPRCTLPVVACSLLATLNVTLPTATAAPATPPALTATVGAPAPVRTDGFTLGSHRAPNGDTITVDSRSLLLNGARWTPVMGEFHFSRYPANEWAEELRKMKAGGVDIVATYVFWIHHEEVEGHWDWSGNKDLHRFVQLAAEAGLKVIVRAGPWCHGEVRNGGLPDWVVARGGVRSEDPAFLALTTDLYTHIATALQGELWKDGGPVIGLQLDNEYRGPASYLLALQKIARDAGLDVPLYTRTGWPALQTPMPFGQILPLYGVYAEGFWDRETTLMPGKYWAGFHFSTLRIDANIANEALGRREVQDPAGTDDYPYLTCEIGGGMMSSYHRRIVVDPRDIVATTLVKLGSGSVSPGYYMYHGGINPVGALSTLMEAQATPMTNWNDLPERNYDFQAPLGQFGQVNPQFYALRPLHAFLHAFGSRLATMDTFLPDQRPTGSTDTQTLRWALRSDGTSGFLFVNHHERGRPLPTYVGARFTVQVADGSALTWPDQPVNVPDGASFLWPFNLPLAPALNLRWATAQPVTTHRASDTTEFVFMATADIPARFQLDDGSAPFALAPGETHILTAGDATVRLRLLSASAAEHLGLAPSPAAPADLPAVSFTAVRPAGPLREIRLATARQPVATAPVAADFDAAARWQIDLPPDLDLATTDLVLRLSYVGDVARVYVGDEFITDDFYNGQPLEIGLRRLAPALRRHALQLAILPLQKSAVTGATPLIYLPTAAQPDFAEQAALAQLVRAELVPREHPTSVTP